VFTQTGLGKLVFAMIEIYDDNSLQSIYYPNPRVSAYLSSDMKDQM